MKKDLRFGYKTPSRSNDRSNCMTLFFSLTSSFAGQGFHKKIIPKESNGIEEKAPHHKYMN